MIKDSKLQSVILRKTQYPSNRHHHHHHNRRQNYHSHHHHPRYRIHQRDLKQQKQDFHHKEKIQLRENIKHKSNSHPHHLFGDDATVDDVTVLHRQPHSHNHHHLRLHNNSEFPLNLQKATLRSKELQVIKQKQESESAIEVEDTNYNIKQEFNYHAQALPCVQTLISFKGSVNSSHHKSKLPLVKSCDSTDSDKHNRPCHYSLRGRLRKSPSVPSTHHCLKLCTVSRFSQSRQVLGQQCKTSSVYIANEPQSESYLNSCQERNTCFCLGKIYDKQNTDLVDYSAKINSTIPVSFCRSSNISGNINYTGGGDFGNSNNNSSEDIATPTLPGTPANLADVASPYSPNIRTVNMHLPIQATLADGSRVRIDEATDMQVSEMYEHIQQAATVGEGYGVDEYPTEADFRHEIRGGLNFVVVREEPGDQGPNLQPTRRGKMLAAFILADSKYYRGTDFKVADPIIVVGREDRRKGIGEFIFRQVVQICRRLNYAGIYIDTFSNNAAMIRIIERSPGFKHVGFLPLGGKMPDGSFVGANIYFKDLRLGCDLGLDSSTSTSS